MLSHGGGQPLAAALLLHPNSPPGFMNLDSHQAQVSYIIGRDLARNFAQQGLELDIDTLVGALKEGLQGLPSRLTQEECRPPCNRCRSRWADPMKTIIPKTPKL